VSVLQGQAEVHNRIKPCNLWLHNLPAGVAKMMLDQWLYVGSASAYLDTLLSAFEFSRSGLSPYNAENDFYVAGKVDRVSVPRGVWP
jgi:hypothetical protein